MVIGWKKKKLGDIAEVCMCKRIFSGQTTASGDIPFFKIGTFGKKPDAYISRSLFEEYKRKYSSPDKGDILLSAAGTIGRTVVYDGKPAYFQDSNIVWLKVDHDQICNEYLSQYYRVIAWASPEGSTISRLYNGIIRATDIRLPSLPEQTAIAEALSDADSLIASLQKLIAKKKAIKQGAMQELLTGKRRLPGFSEEWIEKTFAELFYINGGVSASRAKLSSEGFCYLHYGDIHASSKQYIDTSTGKEKIPRLNIPLSKINKVSLLKNGDIVFVDASEDDEGTCKHIVIRNIENIPYISGLHTIICSSKKNNELENLFKEYCFCSKEIHKQIIYFAAGTKVKGINKTNIAKILLAFPADLKEQFAIAKVLSDMDAEIEQLEKKLSKYQQVKQGMMQELLTGRIRLLIPSQSKGNLTL